MIMQLKLKGYVRNDYQLKATVWVGGKSARRKGWGERGGEEGARRPRTTPTNTPPHPTLPLHANNELFKLAVWI